MAQLIIMKPNLDGRGRRYKTSECWDNFRKRGSEKSWTGDSIRAELAKWGAVMLTSGSYNAELIFETEEDRLAFLLRWS